MDLICVGEMLIDFTPGSMADEFRANPGGAPANVAVMAARSGVKTAFLGKLGEDDFGRRLMSVLKADQVEPLCREMTDKAITTLAFVNLDKNGERSFTFARRPGADMLLTPEDVRQEDIEQCRILHAGSFSMSKEPARGAVTKAVRMAHSLGKIVSFDINYRDMIWNGMEKCIEQVDQIAGKVDLLKISEEELAFVGGEEALEEYMIKNRITVLMETLGSKGVRYFFRRSAGSIASGMIEGRKVYAVDATGAGDSFWGGFLARLLQFGIHSAAEITEDMVKVAAQYGNVAGSLCVQSWGGIPALPNKARIEEILKEEGQSL